MRLNEINYYLYLYSQTVENDISKIYLKYFIYIIIACLIGSLAVSFLKQKKNSMEISNMYNSTINTINFNKRSKSEKLILTLRYFFISFLIIIISLLVYNKIINNANSNDINKSSNALYSDIPSFNVLKNACESMNGEVINYECIIK